MIRFPGSTGSSQLAPPATVSGEAPSGSKEAAMLELQRSEVRMEVWNAIMDTLANRDGANRLDLSFCLAGKLPELLEALPETCAYLGNNIEHLTLHLSDDDLPPCISKFHKLVSLTAQDIEQSTFDAKQLSAIPSFETLYVESPGHDLMLILAGSGTLVRSSGVSPHKVRVLHYHEDGEIHESGVVGQFYMTNSYGCLDRRSLNCRARFPNGRPIECRHITLYEAIGRYQYMQYKARPESEEDPAVHRNWATQRVEKIGSRSELSKEIGPAADSGYFELMEWTPCSYEIGHSRWGAFIRSQFEGMQPNQIRQFYALTYSHAFLLSLRAKPCFEGNPSYVVMLYDPNATFTEKKIIERDMSRVEKLTMLDFIREDIHPGYYGERDAEETTTSSIFIEIPTDWLEQGRLAADIFSEQARKGERHMVSMLSPAEEEDPIRTYYRAMMHLPLREHLAMMLEGCDGNRSEQFRQVSARTPSGRSTLYIAMENGNVEAVSTLLEALQPFGNAERLQVLDGVLFMAMQEGHTGTVEAFLTAVASFRLHPSEVVPLLAAKNGGAAPGLLMAMQDGHTGVVDAFLKALHAFELNPSELVELVAARNATLPGLLTALQNGHADTISAYLTALHSFTLTRPARFELLAAKHENGMTGLYMALQEDQAAAVDAFLAALPSFPLDKSELAELLAARGQSNAPGLLVALRNGSINAMTAFLKALPSFGLDTSQLVELLAAKGRSMRPALYVALKFGQAEAVVALLNAMGALPLDKYQLEELLTAREMNGSTGLYMALQNGHTCAVDAFLAMLPSLGLDKIQLAELLSAKSDEDTPGLFMAMQDGDAATVEAYLKALPSFALDKTQLAELLAAQDDAAYPGLFVAFQNGHADIVASFLKALVALELDTSQLVSLLAARNAAGTPGLFMAFQEGHTHVVQALLNDLATLKLDQAQLIELLAATDAKGRTGFSIALGRGHVDVVEALLAALPALGFEEGDAQRSTVSVRGPHDD
ncbi:ShET2 enterotoxin, N-terminal region [Cupriavidus sp. YR651]|uniref:ShET2/EspL2 family type III secretion system effector toxin n=1 Tax=Cupriavidus sp. YR651 TaxID=1855315 RepID=UPI0008813E93|nr:ShET2/EspL2 family type III secretion system effector toxin [Cupriavidus sp. YR651]SDD37888.1 ShET2 enterotoxin, N-terminal region [Cupriavidus sp. YR651]